MPRAFIVLSARNWMMRGQPQTNLGVCVDIDADATYFHMFQERHAFLGLPLPVLLTILLILLCALLAVLGLHCRFDAIGKFGHSRHTCVTVCVRCIGLIDCAVGRITNLPVNKLAKHHGQGGQ